MSHLYISDDKRLLLSIGYQNAVPYHIQQRELLHITGDMAGRLLNQEGSFPEKIKNFLNQNYHFVPFHDALEEPLIFRRIYLELTNYCNFRCKNCYHANSKNKKFIDDAVLEKIDQLPTHQQVTTLALVGGEPLFFPRQKLKFYIKKWVHCFRQITLFTNASLMSPRDMDFLGEYCIDIRLTFYAADAQKHNQYTAVKNSFEALLEKVKRLIKNKNLFTIALVFDGPDILLFKNKKTIFNEDPFRRYIVFSEVRKPSRHGYDNVALLTARNQLYHDQYRPLTLPRSLEKIKIQLNYHPCLAGIMTLDVNGNFYSCPMRQKSLGNILEIDCNKQDIRNLLDWKMPLKKEHADCSVCEFNFACRSCVYMETMLKDLKAAIYADKPYFCRYHPREGKYDTPILQSCLSEEVS